MTVNKIIKDLNLIPQLRFGASDYCKATKTIQVTMSHELFMLIIEYGREYFKPIPKIEMISSSGRSKIFTNGKYMAGYSLRYTCDDMTLKILDGLKTCNT